jgi:hypothetical protein
MLLAAVAATSSTFGQQLPDLTRYGFQAEPGVAVGTPCGLNVVARFWYGYVGVSASGIYLPASVNFMSGSGVEGALCLRLSKKAKVLSPQFMVGYGRSNIIGTVSGKSYGLTTSYVGAYGGFSYLGVFAHVGLGLGSLKLGSGSKIPVVPLFKVGWAKAIGG